MTYKEKLLDPRWQRKRLEILQRDNFTCRSCFNNKDTLHIHHLNYEANTEPWEYPDFYLITLCENCHTELQEDIKKATPEIIKALKFKLQDSFIWNCAEYIFNQFQDLNGLIYLLWELKEEKVMEILNTAFINESDKRKKITFSPENKNCPFCGGDISFIEKFNVHQCTTCKLVLNGEPIS